MADISTTTNPSVSNLVRQWEIARARFRLETLEIPDDDDTAMGAASDREQGEAARLYDEIGVAEPESFSDVASLLDMAIRLFEDDSASDADHVRALGLVKKARWGVSAVRINQPTR